MAKCEWRDPHDREYRCALEAVNGQSLCIFHSPEEKDVGEFKRRLYAQLDCQGPDNERNPRYDFRGYVFPVGLSVWEKREAVDAAALPRAIQGGVNFKFATIKGGVNFGGTTFEGSVNFWRATIMGSVNFVEAMIEGGVNFGRTTIGKDAIFGGITIKEDAIFGGVTIGGSADFEFATIRGRADFAGATIVGGVSFAGAEIAGSTDVRTSQIKEVITCAGAGIGKYASFRSATINGDADFEFATINGVANFWGARIKGAIIFAGADIGGRTCFTFADADGLLLRAGTPTIRPTFRWSQRSLANRCGITLRDLATAHEFWRFAQRVFEKEGARERADAAFYFSRLTRLSPWRVKREGTWKEQATQILRRIGMLPGWLADCLFLRWPIGYGASLSRTIASWFTIIGGFAIVYATVPGALAGPREELWTASNWSRALYSSVSVFLTLGMGAVQESCNLGRTLIAVEGVLGALLMALTVAVVTRKFMR